MCFCISNGGKRDQRKKSDDPKQAKCSEMVTKMETDELFLRKNSTGLIIWQWIGFRKEDVEHNAVISKIRHKKSSTSPEANNFFV